MRVVHGIDFLKIGFHVDWSGSTILEQLELAKKEAIAKHESIPFRIGDYIFNCEPAGRRLYRWHLRAGDVSVFFSTHKVENATPNVRVEIGSVSCWAPGYEKVLENILNVIEIGCGRPRGNCLSEAHMCCDFVGTSIAELPVDKNEQWVTRASTFRPYYDYQKFTGVQIGKGQITLRIYDKVQELKEGRNVTKQKLFAEIWGVPRYDDVPVVRIEYQLRRSVLKKAFGLNTLADFEAAMTSLWQDYLTTRWSRLCSRPVNRNNRKVEKDHAWWEIVKKQEFGGDNLVTRGKRYPTKSIETYKKIIAGCCLSANVINGVVNADDKDLIVENSLAITRESIEELAINRTEFQRKLLKKHAEIWGPLPF